jgi:hypothetical protein
MTQVVLEPGNPHDFTQNELDELSKLLQGKHGVDVRTVFRPERGYGVTFHEVIHVFVNVSEAATSIAGGVAVLKTVVTWAQNRWRKDRDQDPRSKPRPRDVMLYDGRGKPLKRVTIDSPSGEPTEEEPLDESGRIPPDA